MEEFKVDTGETEVICLKCGKESIIPVYLLQCELCKKCPFCKSDKVKLKQ